MKRCRQNDGVLTLERRNAVTGKDKPHFDTDHRLASIAYRFAISSFSNRLRGGIHRSCGLNSLAHRLLTAHLAPSAEPFCEPLSEAAANVPMSQEGAAVDYQESVISARERELLVLRAQTGESEALNLLFESCRPRLYFQALRILNRPQDAEDAVQDAMVAAFRNLHRFQRRSDFLTWATRIVINAALLQIRRDRVRPTQVEGAFNAVQLDNALRDLQPNPEEQMQALEHWELLEFALEQLPVESRRPIQLCKFSDYSLKEAAAALGLPVSTLKVRLHRGKRALTVHVKRNTRLGKRRSLRGMGSVALPAKNVCAA